MTLQRWNFISGVLIATIIITCFGYAQGPEHQQLAPEWPVEAFLQAESRLADGDRDGANAQYIELLEYATKPPTSTRLPSIVAIAFWRLLESFDASETSPEFIFRIADNLLTNKHLTRLFDDVRLQSSGISLSGFAEQIWHSLAFIAWQSEDRPRAVVYLFSTGASSSPSTYGLQDQIESSLKQHPLTSSEREIVDRLLSVYGLRDREYYGGQTSKVALWSAERLIRLRYFSNAVPYLREVLDTAIDPAIRSKAGVNLARIGPRVGIGKGEIIRLLDSAIDDAKLARDENETNDTLIQRALVYDRSPDRSFDRAVADLRRVVTDFPMSEQAGKALYLLARLHEWNDDYNSGMNYYAQAARHIGQTGASSWRESAHFRAALMHYMEGHLDRAILELESLRTVINGDTSSPFYPLTLYWLGRMLSESGQEQSYQTLLRGLAEADPFSFYGIRARMYLNVGTSAPALTWPDPSTTELLREAYQRLFAASNEPSSDDPHVRRLLWAVRTGLYRSSFRSSQRLFSNSSVRFNGSNPDYLDLANLLVPVVIWQTLRHDIIGAEGLRNGFDSRIYVANKLADLGDFSTALIVLAYHGQPLDHRGYLAALYPPAFRETIQVVADQFDAILPELVYSVMRSESRFSLGAMSVTGARGLFQFQPRTFFQLDQRWRLLTEDSQLDMDGYLSDPNLSITLGARWFSEILDNRSGDLVLSVMEHHAGAEKVDRWFNAGLEPRHNGRFANDLDLKVEMARQPATRNFTRDVLGSIWISKIVQMFP